MGNTTNISWTDATWNIARGCTKVSEGCKYCYMMRDGEKFGYDGTVVQRTKTVFDMPLKYQNRESSVWSGRPLIFTSSLTDVFHPDIDGFRGDMWEIIMECPHLIFQILTKRPERWPEQLPYSRSNIGVDNNVWMGVSVENQKALNDRATYIRWLKYNYNVPVFLSVEPLLGHVDLSGMKDSIDWVIIGGESGNDNGNWKYRECNLSWIVQIIDWCRQANVPVFLKQLGTYLSKDIGFKDRHGADAGEWPKWLNIREFPTHLLSKDAIKKT